MNFRNLQEARSAFAGDIAMLNERGIYPLESVQTYLPDGWRSNAQLAMDELPALVTDPNSALPAILTTMIDPTPFEILFAPTKAAEVLGEIRKGDWTTDTTLFPVVEHTGEVSSYGDHSNNGRTGVNTNWPARQAYHFQTMKEYGDRELARVGLGKINLVSEIDKAAATVMNRFQNLSYFYGIQGLQNYGLLNDPNLSAALTPAVKAKGGTAWIVAGAINATANEVYADFQALFLEAVSQSGGLVNAESKMVLSLSPGSAVALTATNAFNVNVHDLLKKNFPNLRFVDAVQYGAYSASNPQGSKAGNTVQLVVEEIEGQDTGFCGFTEKMRAFPIIRRESSYRQKVMGGSWGAVIRMPLAITQLVGV